MSNPNKKRRPHRATGNLKGRPPTVVAKQLPPANQTQLESFFALNATASSSSTESPAAIARVSNSDEMDVNDTDFVDPDSLSVMDMDLDEIELSRSKFGDAKLIDQRDSMDEDLESAPVKTDLAMVAEGEEDNEPGVQMYDDDENLDQELPVEEKLLSTSSQYLYLLGVSEKVKMQADSTGLECYKQGTIFIHPTDSAFALAGARPNPNALYQVRLAVFAPHLLPGFQRHYMPCPAGCQGRHLYPKGWADNPGFRRVVDIRDNFYLMVYRYRCKGCNKGWYSSNSQLLDAMPPWITEMFPAVISHRSAVSKTLHCLIRPTFFHGFGPTPFADMLRESHVERYDELRAAYMERLLAYRSSGTITSMLEPDAPAFSAFDDKNGYNGFTPSAKYIKSLYVRQMNGFKITMDAIASMAPLRIGAIDLSFKITKRLAKLNGVPMWGGLLTVTNENGSIIVMLFVPSKAQDHWVSALENVRDSLIRFGHSEPELFYTDNVDADRALLERIFPSLLSGVCRVETEEYQDLDVISVPFEPKELPVIETTGQINDFFSTVMESGERHKQQGGMLVIGMDAEWEFDLRSKFVGKLALVQIMFENQVYLIRTSFLTRLPQMMIHVMESKDIVKVGRQIGGDLAKLHHDFMKKSDKSFAGALELGNFAVRRGLVDSGRVGLAKLCAKILEVKLPKEAAVRFSYWGQSTLSQEQILYAATDVYVSLKLYEAMKEIPTLTERNALITNGDSVSLMSDDKRKRIAHGILLNDASLKKGAAMSNVKINKVLVPGAKIRMKGPIPLGQRGALPFDLLVKTKDICRNSDKIFDEDKNSEEENNEEKKDDVTDASVGDDEDESPCKYFVGDVVNVLLKTVVFAKGKISSIEKGNVAVTVTSILDGTHPCRFTSVVTLGSLSVPCDLIVNTVSVVAVHHQTIKASSIAQRSANGDANHPTAIVDPSALSPQPETLLDTDINDVNLFNEDMGDDDFGLRFDFREGRLSDVVRERMIAEMRKDPDIENLGTLVCTESEQLLQVCTQEPDFFKRIFSRVLADIWHEFNKLSLSRKHTLLHDFCCKLRDTVFQLDAEDCQAVEAVLKSKSITWDDALRSDESYMWKRIKRWVPPPDILHPALCHLFKTYGPLKCVRTNLPLFSPATWVDAKKILENVRRGHWSDPPGVSLYTIVGRDADGLQLLRCLRGTQTPEGGVHRHLIPNIGAFGASAEYADAHILDFRYRKNVQQEAMLGKGGKHRGHFNPDLSNRLHELHLLLQMPLPPDLNNWINSTYYESSGSPTGIAAIPQHLKESLGIEGFVEDKAKKYKNLFYVARRQGTRKAVLRVHTISEMRLFKVLQSEFRKNFESMAAEWNRRVSMDLEVDIYYKLPDHLRLYHVSWEKARDAEGSKLVAGEGRRTVAQQVKDNRTDRIPPAIQATALTIPAPAARPQPIATALSSIEVPTAMPPREQIVSSSSLVATSSSERPPERTSTSSPSEHGQSASSSLHPGKEPARSSSQLLLGGDAATSSSLRTSIHSLPQPRPSIQPQANSCQPSLSQPQLSVWQPQFAQPLQLRQPYIQQPRHSLPLFPIPGMTFRPIGLD